MSMLEVSTPRYELIAISIALNATSIFIGLCVAISFLSMAYYRPDLADRISLRLIFVANAASFSFSICLIAMLSVQASNIQFCIAAAVMIIVSDTAASMALIIVGVNLFVLVVLSNPKYTPNERVYFLLICSASAINGLVVFLYGVIHPHQPYEEAEQNETRWHGMHQDIEREQGFIWKYYYICRAAVFVLSVILFFSIIIALKVKKDWFKNMLLQQNTKPTGQQGSQSQDLTSSYHELGSSQSRYTSIYHKVAFHCVLYVLVLMVTRSFGVVFIIQTRAQKDPDYRFLIANYALSGTQGILLGLIYFSDPAVVASAKELIHYLKTRRSGQIIDEEKGVYESVNVAEWS